MKKQKIKRIILFAAIFILALIFLCPLFIAGINSFKTLGDIISEPLSLPKKLLFSNYANAFTTLEIPKVMANTAIVTLGSVVGIVIFSAMTAYWAERHPTIYSKVFEKLLILSMLIPFASIMIPIVQVMKTLHLNSTLQGTIITYWGVGLAFAYFMMRGAVKGLPYELEEAAKIDGCGPVKVFFKVVMPLLQPTMVTVFVMDIFWVWNDFIIPLILLDNGKLSTIQLAIKKLFSMYATKWDLALPGLMMSILPIVIVFIVLQKKIINGIMAGAVKG